MNKFHKIKNLEFESDWLTIEIDGKIQKFDLNKISSKLSSASDIEKTTYEISPSGYGVHWPLLDEDISIDGLLGIRRRPECEKLRA